MHGVLQAMLQQNIHRSPPLSLSNSKSRHVKSQKKRNNSKTQRSQLSCKPYMYSAVTRSKLFRLVPPTARRLNSESPYHDKRPTGQGTQPDQMCPWHRCSDGSTSQLRTVPRENCECGFRKASHGLWRGKLDIPQILGKKQASRVEDPNAVHTQATKPVKACSDSNC